jgi:hypothetical protein
VERSSIIATVVAGGGVLIAASVATVAVINAAASSASQPATVAMVAQTQALTGPSTSNAGFPSPSASTFAPAASPSPEVTHDLPPLPSVPERTAAPSTDQPATSAPTHSSRPKATASTPKATATHRPKPSSSATPTPSATQTQPPAEIAADQARDAVLQATGGGVTQSVTRDSHGGFDAWAVQVLRHDGSLVTGYVDRRSGVVYDWKVDKEAPTASATPSQSSGSGSGSGKGGDDHGGKGGDGDHDSDDD